MEATEVTVQTKTDGGLEPVKDTIYSTEYGPMIDNLVGDPAALDRGLAASRSRDVNATNFRYLNHFYDNNLAQSVAEYDAVQRRYQGIPWVNSIAADSEGNAYYSMQGAIPNVPDELAARVQHARARLRGARPAGARRLALGLQLGGGPGRGRPRHLPAPTRCRRCSATTTSTTATTATG